MNKLSKILSLTILVASLMNGTAVFAHGMPDIEGAKTNLVNESFFVIAKKSIDEEIAKGPIKGELTRALVIAIEKYKDTKIMDYLIEKGADINGTDHIGPKPIHVIAADGSLNQVKAFFKHKPDITLKDGSMRNALLGAFYDQHDLRVIKFLVAQGLDLKSRDTSGRNAILIAAYRNPNIDIWEYLKDQGLDFNLVTTDHGDSAIFRATNNKNAVNIIQWLRDNGVDYKTVNYHDRNVVGYMAQRSGRSKNFDLLKSFVADGVSVLAKDENGRNALLIAAERNDDLEVIKYFAKQGAPINEFDKTGRNALNIAAYRNKAKVVKYFIDAGLDVNVADVDGKTALIWAASRNKIEVVNMLLAAGADAKTVDKNGLNAAMHIINREAGKKTKKGSIKALLEVLVNAGANLTSVSDKGETALITATKNGHHLDTLEYLVAGGADINASNSYKLTPLMYAAMKSHDANVIEFLLAKGAKTDQVDDFGDTVVDLVKENELLKGSNAVELIEKAINK